MIEPLSIYEINRKPLSERGFITIYTYYEVTKLFDLFSKQTN